MAGRSFEFLAYSSSQLKESSCFVIDSSPATLVAVRKRATQLLGGPGPSRFGITSLFAQDPVQVALRSIASASSPMRVVHAWFGDFKHIKVRSLNQQLGVGD